MDAIANVSAPDTIDIETGQTVALEEVAQKNLQLQQLPITARLRSTRKSNAKESVLKEKSELKHEVGTSSEATNKERLRPRNKLSPSAKKRTKDKKKFRFSVSHNNVKRKSNISVRYATVPSTLNKRTDILLYKCRVCSRQFSKRITFNAHVKKHCGKRQVQSQVLKDVLSKGSNQDSHSIDEPPKLYRCSACSKIFKDKSSCEQHTKTHIQTTNEQQEKQALEEGELSTQMPAKLYRCGLCQEMFSDKVSCVKHAQAHLLTPPAPKVSKQTSREGSQEEKSHQKLYRCSVCKEMFNDKNACKKHMRTHPLNPTGQSSEPKSKTQTLESTQSVEKPEILKYVLADASDGRKCPGQKPAMLYRCSLCKMSFDDEDTSERHLEMHIAKPTDIPKVHEPNSRVIPSESLASCDKCGVNGKSIDEECSCGRSVKTQSSAYLEISGKKCLIEKSPMDDTVTEDDPCLPAEDLESLPAEDLEMTDEEEMTYSSIHSNMVTQAKEENGPVNSQSKIESPGGKPQAQSMFVWQIKTSHVPLHKQAKLYRCSTCNATFSDESACEKHVKIHTQNSAEPSSRPGLLRELLTKGSEIGKVSTISRVTYWCRACNRRFDDRSSLDKHVVQGSCVGLNRTEIRKPTDTLLHSEVPDKPEYLQTNSSLGSSENSPGNSTRTYGPKGTHCIVCKMEFQSKTELFEHIDHEHSQMKFLKSTVYGFNPDHICGICKKTFKAAAGLVSHMRIHSTEEWPPTCKVCNQVFGGEFDLRRHMVEHTNVWPFLCDECGLGFMRNSRLTRHKLEQHTEIKPHQCEVCEQRFTEKWVLKNHMMTHTDERRHQCTECGKMFRQKKCLIVHQDTHSKVRLECHICGKSLKGKESLRFHMAKHESSMKETAEGEHPIIQPLMPTQRCKVCSKSFKSKSALTMHARSHTSGEWPPRCKVCDQTFGCDRDLRKHLKNVNQALTSDTHLPGDAATQEEYATPQMTHTHGDCEEMSPEEKLLACHMRDIHSESQPKVRQVYRNEKLRNVYPCEVCLDAFTSKASWTKHMRTHTASELKLISKGRQSEGEEHMDNSCNEEVTPIPQSAEAQTVVLKPL